MNRSLKYLLPLLVVVVLNYLAQIPYYFHQYYIGRHLAPSWPGTVLLLFTFLWFLAGYTRFVTSKQYGVGLLLSFLAAQVLFYGHAIIFGLINGGGAVAQLKTHSPFLFVIFLIGYINFGVAAYYLVRLLKDKSNANTVQ
ncbi:MAG TPA: hypothetical protein VN778_02715 [Verrucomicrobiae bacterium]|nr:hypothetical protein [Verrucomicrobiae bacterium]